jgi:hypothetical protein
MSSNQAGVYLISDFDWPRPMTADQPKKARQLHDLVQNQSWIKEVVATGGGLGSGPSSIWIFWLENYAAKSACPIGVNACRRELSFAL